MLYYGWYVAGKPDTKRAREEMDSIKKARAERLAKETAGKDVPA